MTIKGEIAIFAKGLEENNRIDARALISDINARSAPIKIDRIYTSLPIPDDFFFPSGNRFCGYYEEGGKVEEEWEQDFIEWAKRKYKINTILKIRYKNGSVAKTIDLEQKIESPKYFNKEISNLLEYSEVTDGEGSLWQDTYFYRPCSVDNRSKEICDILKHYPSPRTKALISILKQSMPENNIMASYLIKKFGPPKSKFKLSDKYGTAFPVVAKGDISEEFIKNACKLYAIDTGLGSVRGFCTYPGYTNIAHKILIYIKHSKAELRLPEGLTGGKLTKGIINEQECIETLRLLARHVTL